MAVLVVIPHIFGFLRTPEGYYFGGVNSNFNFADIRGVYFSAIRYFSEGGLFYQNPYDWPSKSFFHYPTYVFLGKIVAITSLPVEFVYYLSSFVLSIAFSLFLFKFLNLFYTDFRRNFSTFVFAIFGGLFFFPIPEGVGLFSLMHPHFIVAQMAMFAVLYYLFSRTTGKDLKSRDFIIFTFCVFCLSFTHPWMNGLIMAIYLVWSLYLKFIKNNIRVLNWWILIFASISIFTFYYYVNLSSVHWVNFKLPIDIFSIVMLYGPFLFFGMMGVWLSFKKLKDSKFIFVSIWFIIQLIFVNLPLPFARRFVEGFYLPMAITTIIAIDWLVSKLRIQRWQFLFSIGVFVIISMGVLSNYLLFFVWIPNDIVYGSIEEKEAMRFLSENSQADERLFSHPATGVYAAGFSNMKFFIGHIPQTPFFETKLTTVTNYYQGNIDENKRTEVLLNEQICYVYYGPDEKKSTSINLSEEDYLDEYYKNSLITIYKTKWC